MQKRPKSQQIRAKLGSAEGLSTQPRNYDQSNATRTNSQNVKKNKPQGQGLRQIQEVESKQATKRFCEKTTS